VVYFETREQLVPLFIKQGNNVFPCLSNKGTTCSLVSNKGTNSPCYLFPCFKQGNKFPCYETSLVYHLSLLIYHEQEQRTREHTQIHAQQHNTTQNTIQYNTIQHDNTRKKERKKNTIHTTDTLHKKNIRTQEHENTRTRVHTQIHAQQHKTSQHKKERKTRYTQHTPYTRKKEKWKVS